MNPREKREFEKFRAQIVGTKLVSIWIGIGFLRFKRSWKDRDDMVNDPDVFFVMESGWRIRKGRHIVIGCEDSVAHRTYEERERIAPGTRRRAITLLDRLVDGELEVIDVRIPNSLDMTVYLKHGYRIEAFAETNSNDSTVSAYGKAETDSWVLTTREGFLSGKQFKLPADDTAIEPVP